ncbi:fimbrial protein [Erwinia billingiae]|uniref:fimbrial protein n=2 Tax=Erwinia billingiae TaxID=182337 RepID=UPI0012442F0D|nr:fimbrial protein [Erwinia billingiae]QEW32605.1 fimbrial protein [Erwinia billingiae]
MKRLFFLAVTLALLSASASALETGGSKSFSLHGHVAQAETPCTLNEGQMIDVPFGNVSINKVGSGQYLKNISYSINCVGIKNQIKFKMILVAPGTDWDPQAMVSSVEGLGVRIVNDGTPIALNRVFNIDLDHPPTLQAQLVTKTGLELTGRPFTAGGTLLVEYL